MKHLIILVALAVLVTTAGCGKRDYYPDVRTAPKITCFKNLEMVSVAFSIWQGEHDGKYPFEVSTNAGGVMELVTAKDGMRQNGYLIFQCMSNKLSNPLLAVCPHDKTKHVAKDWASLTASNCSYIFPMTNNVLLVCPLDGNAIYLDGRVLDKNGEMTYKSQQE